MVFFDLANNLIENTSVGYCMENMFTFYNLLY